MADVNNDNTITNDTITKVYKFAVDPKKILAKNEESQARLEARISKLEKHLENCPKDWKAVIALLQAKSDLNRVKMDIPSIKYQIEIEKYRELIKNTKKTGKTATKKKKASNSNRSSSLTVDKYVQWFEDRKGKITYSMAGSRNGSDGTGDCSGCMSQALKDAGIPIQGLPSTVTLGSQLQANGFQRIAVNNYPQWQKGDIVLMSKGANMASSGGAGGHVGTMKTDNIFISCDFSTGGARGTAVSEFPIVDYLKSRGIPYFEVWRYTK